MVTTWSCRSSRCAEWWERVLASLKKIELTLLIGKYAQDWHLDDPKGTLTERVKNWRSEWPRVIPLPHPSPRNNIWLRRNPWFEEELIPELQARMRDLLRKTPCNR
jgi:uracil-DNA glycosylase